MKKIGSFALLVLVGLLLASCYGPSPQVVSHKLVPPEAKGSPYILAVTVRNVGGGQGQVDVQGKLNSKRTGKTVASGDELVELQPRETQQVEIQLNPVAKGPYKQLVKVQYPP